MLEPTPTINKAYAMLVERESQRSIISTSMSEEGTDLTVLMAGRGGPPRYNK